MIPNGKRALRRLAGLAKIASVGLALGHAVSGWAGPPPPTARAAADDSLGVLLPDIGKAPAGGAPVAPAPPKDLPAPEVGPRPSPVSRTDPKMDAAKPGADAARTPLPIDLAYALRLANTSNPTIALARERIREADAGRQQAGVLWVPSAFLGGNPHAPAFVPTFYHHDGQIQNARGQVFDTVRNNMFLQTGATLDFHLADAIFAPRIASQNEAAIAARARTVDFEIQLEVAYAYLDLLRVYGAMAITAESLAKAEEMLRFAEQAERNGLGKTTADANRARAQVEALRQEQINYEAQAAIASARLAQLLLLDPTVDLVPADKAVVPVALICTDVPLDELIAVALMSRPELAESRALVQAALTAWRGNKLRPLIPTLQVFFYGGSFQGGNPGFGNTGGRDDLLAQAAWELRNGGLGDYFRVKEARSRLNQANLHVVEVQAQVSAEVAGSAKVVQARERALRSAQESVRQAEEMWTRLSKAAFGLAGPARKYDPLEPLLAQEQLYRNRLRYLDEVINYNRYQFRLYWAMGKPPMDALPEAKPLAVQVPVLPDPAQRRDAVTRPGKQE